MSELTSLASLADVSDGLLDELEALAWQAAKAAGHLLVTERPLDNELQVATKSTPSDVVTEMDEAAEAVITALIRTYRPHDAIIGEEGATGIVDVDSAQIRWVIDPLDGTVNYLYRIPCWAVSIGVQVRIRQSVARRRGGCACPGAGQHLACTARRWSVVGQR